MKLIGLMACRNEDWVIGLSARTALMWCDELVVLLHACTDQSLNILEGLEREQPARVVVRGMRHECWTEMAHRQMMLEMARERGATHIAYIDADEILTGNLIPRIRDIIEFHCETALLNLPWIALARDPLRYIAGSSVWGESQKAMVAFRDNPNYHWAARNGYDFHQRPPLGGPHRYSNPLKHEQGGLMHLQFLSERRLRAKQALYQCTEVLRWPGRLTRVQLAQMYGRAVYESDPVKHNVQTLPTPPEWWLPYNELVCEHLDLTEDKEPWQEIEVKRLVAEHGRERLAGLDLFGVA